MHIHVSSSSSKHVVRVAVVVQVGRWVAMFLPVGVLPTLFVVDTVVSCFVGKILDHVHGRLVHGRLVHVSVVQL